MLAITNNLLVLGGLDYFIPGAIAFDVPYWRDGRVLQLEKLTAGELVDPRIVYRGFAYWASVTGDPRSSAIARRIAQFYYN